MRRLEQLDKEIGTVQSALSQDFRRWHYWSLDSHQRHQSRTARFDNRLLRRPVCPRRIQADRLCYERKQVGHKMKRRPQSLPKELAARPRMVSLARSPENSSTVLAYPNSTSQHLEP